LRLGSLYGALARSFGGIDLAFEPSDVFGEIAKSAALFETGVGEGFGEFASIAGIAREAATDQLGEIIGGKPVIEFVEAVRAHLIGPFASGGDAML
jgi:hypothetical protein